MKNQIECGVLYVVATPIGNLQDITLRALETLKAAEVIFAEDTRVTRKLLEQYGITPPTLISCHEHNESKRIEQLMHYLDLGKITLLVSDAGTPLISDPGFTLIKELKACGYKVTPIPGVSALITALCVAGLATDSFQFKGFLPAKSSTRKSVLKTLQQTTITTVFYESTHRIVGTLEDIAAVLPMHNIVIAKELTKQFERFSSGKAHEILQQFQTDPYLVKGEFVVLIEGQSVIETAQTTIDEDKLLHLLLAELPIKKAVAIAVELTAGKKNALYKKALTIQETQSITHTTNG
ncbi:16S rRNA (cytidine(1402)-2'-O)-methyltransferase [Fastidiosibacter lacustris]|uniref:16S rRNA (cytidine(1402)-2'-O)-methyltransferase n=1 Tax=Fastidiosibacter lacustris TaxID=2056695 RepID=UPI000E34DB41|nr:16S rRNA (cytidine(1402)-2'-O)-methyltransferase [Fastidiosibacter lacustris]